MQVSFHHLIESEKYAKIRNLSNQNPNPALKTKRDITNITNSKNIKRTYGQPSEELFPKRWPLSNRNRTKNNMNTHKVKRHQNSVTKTGNIEPQQNYRLGTVSNELLEGGLKHVFRRQPRSQFLKWYKTFSCHFIMI